eukprot:TRINITY_DN48210_c0_g1_i1.p1 TRINITY_DN48210_c0_g1~~TRINITY_DN48210_c0_g1_i1.p1  ORF type:complete len:1611 (+),score=287.97 TRINITY_DN48210_c0_g1_i1:42-4874(+)
MPTPPEHAGGEQRQKTPAPVEESGDDRRGRQRFRRSGGSTQLGGERHAASSSSPSHRPPSAGGDQAVQSTVVSAATTAISPGSTGSRAAAVTPVIHEGSKSPTGSAEPLGGRPLEPSGLAAAPEAALEHGASSPLTQVAPLVAAPSTQEVQIVAAPETQVDVDKDTPHAEPAAGTQVNEQERLAERPAEEQAAPIIRRRLTMKTSPLGLLVESKAEDLRSTRRRAPDALPREGAGRKVASAASHSPLHRLVRSSSADELAFPVRGGGGSHVARRNRANAEATASPESAGPLTGDCGALVEAVLPQDIILGIGESGDGKAAAARSNRRLLRDLAEAFANSCAAAAENVRQGLKTLTFVAGIPAAVLPPAPLAEAHMPSAITQLLSSIAAATEEEGPVHGSLAKLTAGGARRVCTRLEAYFAMATSAMCRLPLCGPALHILATWFAALSLTSLRPLRYAATAAGLGMLEALIKEHKAATANLLTMTKRLDDLRAELGTRTSKVADRLTANVQRISALVNTMAQGADLLTGRFWPHRSRDTFAPIRRLTVASAARLIDANPAVFAAPPWPERVLRATCDPSLEVRLCAMRALFSWYRRGGRNCKWQRFLSEVRKSKSKAAGLGENDADEDEEEDEFGRAAGAAQDDAIVHLADLAPHVTALLFERAKDVEPRVSAAAIGLLTDPALAAHLSETDMDFVASLSHAAPDSHVASREAALIFVNRYMLPEVVLIPLSAVAQTSGKDTESRPLDSADTEAAKSVAPASQDEVSSAEQSLLALTSFLSTSVASGRHLQLACFRVTATLWSLGAPYLTVWGTMVELLLHGEGGTMAPGLKPLPGSQRLALLHILDAALCYAIEDRGGENKVDAVLDEAAEVILPKLPRLLELCAADEASVVPLCGLAKKIVEHLCSRPEGPTGMPRTLVGEFERTLGLPLGRQPAMQLADAWLALARRSSEARGAVSQLAVAIRDACVQMLRPASLHEASDDDFSSLLRLLALSNRGVDLLSVGDKEGQRFELLARTLQVLAVWADGEDQIRTLLSSLVVVQLLELAVTLITWRLRALHLPSGAPGDTLQGSQTTSTDHKYLRSFLQQLQGVSAKMLQTDACSAIKLQALSAYMASLQLLIGAGSALGKEEEESRPRRPLRIHDVELDETGCVVSRKYPLPTVSSSHIVALESGFADLLGWGLLTVGGSSSSTSSRVTTTAWHTEGNFVGTVGIASPSLLLETCCQVHTGGSSLVSQDASHPTEKCWRGNTDAEQRAVLTALIAGRMVAQAEHESIYCGPVGRVLLMKMAHPNAGHSPVLAYTVDELAGRVRQHAYRSRIGAAQYFSMLLGSVGVPAETLRDRLLPPANELPLLHSAVASRFAAGAREAICAYVLSVLEKKQPFVLDTVLALIRGPSCVLNGQECKTMAGELALKIGERAGSGADEATSAAIRAVLLALQASSSSSVQQAPTTPAVHRSGVKRQRVATTPCHSPVSGEWIVPRKAAAADEKADVEEARVDTPLPAAEGPRGSKKPKRASDDPSKGKAAPARSQAKSLAQAKTLPVGSTRKRQVGSVAMPPPEAPAAKRTLASTLLAAEKPAAATAGAPSQPAPAKARQWRLRDDAKALP